ncbi:hypothetical protein OH76DRAFT_1409112 [Lentinus brumalis]|uniref:C2H2-type domain-containing protein n=1 Tax=Lentinus brumalis TaxID=2498619 RepID=A0A371CVV0_9APHY|nr:hypothetical protein OH76DRAFT_1409112 [Polyporus brumalis]
MQERYVRIRLPADVLSTPPFAVFTRKGNMRQHFTTKHDPTASKYHCLHCVRQYTRKSDLTRHVKREHADTDTTTFQ